MSAVIRLENVSYTYGKDTPFEKEALNGVTCEFTRDRITGIIGHTGSGKSTLAQLLNGLNKPASGKVLLDGEDIWKDPKKIVGVRFKVGLVFQYPEYQLFEETVYKDIAFGPKNMKLDPARIDEMVRKAARFAGVGEELLERSPFDLSGGQKRRVAIAGVMAMDPDVVVFDEPAAGLDPGGRDSIFRNIRDYQREAHKTVIIISHSMEDMARFSDELVVMKDGAVLAKGTVDEIFSDHKMLVTSGLDVPQITSLMMELAKDGAGLDTSVYTVDAAYDMIISKIGRTEK